MQEEFPDAYDAI